METAEHYRRIRAEHPTIAATHALTWARFERRLDELESRADVETTYDGRTEITVDGLTLAVSWDTEPYDWGDCEPCEQERDDLEVIVVECLTPLPRRDISAIGGVGYLPPATAEREALRVADECGWFESAMDERRERDECAARGIETIA